MQFSKIRLGGFEADLRAITTTLEVVEVVDPLSKEARTETRRYLWYLDMVGRAAESLHAIWAGIIEGQPAVLESGVEESSPIRNWVYNPGTGRTGGFKLKEARLSRSSACQVVMLPKLAFASKVSQGKGGKEKEQEIPGFLLLRLPRLDGCGIFNISELYHSRLDKLTPLPLLPSWHEWTWRWGLEKGLVQPLEGQGFEAYLCSPPDPRLLALDLGEAVRGGELGKAGLNDRAKLLMAPASPNVKEETAA